MFSLFKHFPDYKPDPKKFYNFSLLEHFPDSEISLIYMCGNIK